MVLFPKSNISRPSIKDGIDKINIELYHVPWRKSVENL